MFCISVVAIAQIPRVTALMDLLTVRDVPRCHVGTSCREGLLSILRSFFFIRYSQLSLESSELM